MGDVVELRSPTSVDQIQGLEIRYESFGADPPRCASI